MTVNLSRVGGEKEGLLGRADDLATLLWVVAALVVVLEVEEAVYRPQHKH